MRQAFLLTALLVKIVINGKAVGQLVYNFEITKPNCQLATTAIGCKILVYTYGY